METTNRLIPVWAWIVFAVIAVAVVIGTVIGVRAESQRQHSIRVADCTTKYSDTLDQYGLSDELLACIQSR